VIEDEEYFGVIYTIDTDDDWAEPASWQKANPNWGISVKPEAIEREARKALQMASAQNNFLTKHLNVWVNADTAWMDMRAWEACEDRSLRLEDFAGQACIVGLDLASKVDIADKVRWFVRDGVHYVFCAHYLPERAVEMASNSQYDGWRREGWLTVTDGEVTDYDVIEDGIREDCERYQVSDVAFDPFQATQMSGHLLAEGVPMIEVRPTVLNFSEPMKQLEALVLSGKLRHNGDPVLTWMISNVVCHRDAKDNIYPRKERPENKIDGVVAMIMCLARQLVTGKPAPEYQILILGGSRK
jgi:phage terminase large subunit-like protein